MATTPLINAGGDTRQAALGMAARTPRTQPLSATESEHLAGSLGQAVALCWGRLPQAAQQLLFDAAVDAEGETIRQKLALFLHEKHARTRASLHARAMPEPDSLGG